MFKADLRTLQDRRTAMQKSIFKWTSAVGLMWVGLSIFVDGLLFLMCDTSDPRFIVYVDVEVVVLAGLFLLMFLAEAISRVVVRQGE